nr:MAG TPA: hypothetical protein [Caudoviricetes sp.]
MCQLNARFFDTNMAVANGVATKKNPNSGKDIY